MIVWPQLPGGGLCGATKTYPKLPILTPLLNKIIWKAKIEKKISMYDTKTSVETVFFTVEYICMFVFLLHLTELYLHTYILNYVRPISWLEQIHDAQYVILDCIPSWCDNASMKYKMSIDMLGVKHFLCVNMQEIFFITRILKGFKQYLLLLSIPKKQQKM